MPSGTELLTATEPPLVILDTNVLVSAVVSPDERSPAKRVVRAVRSESFRLVLSEELMAEFDEVLRRNRLVRSHGLTDGQIDDLLAGLRRKAEFCEPRTPRTPPPDPRDMHVWSLHEAVPEAVLVTGDRALIVGARADRRVMSPREFVDAYGL